MVKIGIPPVDCNYFNRDMFLGGIDCGVAFYCYNQEFGKIASFLPLDHKPGKFYEAIISRFTWNYNRDLC